MKQLPGSVSIAIDADKTAGAADHSAARITFE
jgi:hypothetical protein